MPRLLNLFDSAAQRVDRVCPEVFVFLNSLPHIPLIRRRGFFTTQCSVPEPVHGSCEHEI